MKVYIYLVYCIVSYCIQSWVENSCNSGQSWFIVSFLYTLEREIMLLVIGRLFNIGSLELALPKQCHHAVLFTLEYLGALKQL